MRNSNAAVPLSSLIQALYGPRSADPSFNETGVSVAPSFWSPGDFAAPASSLTQILGNIMGQMPQKTQQSPPIS